MADIGRLKGRHLLVDEAATLALGAQLAGKIAAGSVIFLHGNLGAGKTTLVRGYLQALGHEGPVKSPTFTLVEEYLLGGLRIFHFIFTGSVTRKNSNGWEYATTFPTTRSFFSNGLNGDLDSCRQRISR